MNGKVIHSFVNNKLLEKPFIKMKMHPLSRRTSVKSETIKLITVHLHRLLNYAKTFLATQLL